LQIVDGKARLVADVYCDGLGACLGHCPQGAIIVEEREAAAYDEELAIQNIARQGAEAVKAHLEHLREHDETEHLRTALRFLAHQSAPSHAGGCPGSRSASLTPRSEAVPAQGPVASQLTHWPIQLHLVNPLAPHFHGADLLLSADCIPFAMGNFHSDFLRGKTLAVACPKLDRGQEVYLDKLTAFVDQAQIRTLTVMIMQVPCCSGLLQLARRAVENASRKPPLEAIVVSLQGDVLQRVSSEPV
jgi:hypothetical protein